MDVPWLAAVLVLYSLASAAAVDVWLRGSLFAGARARVEADWPEAGWPRAPLSELLGCAHCLSHQAPIWLLCWGEVPAAMMPDRLAAIWRAPIVALAVGRLTWMLVRRDE